MKKGSRLCRLAFGSFLLLGLSPFSSSWPGVWSLPISGFVPSPLNHPGEKGSRGLERTRNLRGMAGPLLHLHLRMPFSRLPPLSWSMGASRVPSLLLLASPQPHLDHLARFQGHEDPRNPPGPELILPNYGRAVYRLFASLRRLHPCITPSLLP